MEEADEITSQQEEEVSQADLGKMAQSLEDKLFYKNQKRKTKWGPTLRAPRPRRSSDDGRTIMEKAQDLKKAKNLEKGCGMVGSEDGADSDYRMLRGWLPLYKKEAGVQLEGLIVKLEELSRRPA